MTTQKANEPSIAAVDFDLIKQAKQQYLKEKHAADRLTGLTKQLAKLDAEKEKIREREKAARRDQKTQRPTAHLITGTLAARVLLQGLSSPALRQFIDNVDLVLLDVQSPEAAQLKAVLAVETLNVETLVSRIIPAAAAQPVAEGQSGEWKR